MRSMVKSRKLCGFVALFALSVLVGCASLNDTQKAELTLAALAAKERATAFDVIKDRIAPEKAENAIPLKNFIAAHARGLNAQAVGLADLCEAVKAGGTISDPARKMLAEEAKTARSRARNFELTIPDMRAGPNVEPEIYEFIRAHISTLNSQADTLAKLSALLPPKPPKPAPVEKEKSVFNTLFPERQGSYAGAGMRRWEHRDGRVYIGIGAPMWPVQDLKQF